MADHAFGYFKQVLLTALVARAVSHHMGVRNMAEGAMSLLQGVETKDMVVDAGTTFMPIFTTSDNTDAQIPHPFL